MIPKSNYSADRFETDFLIVLIINFFFISSQRWNKGEFIQIFTKYFEQPNIIYTGEYEK